MVDFDETKYVLGSLCRKGHTFEKTTQSLRRRRLRNGEYQAGDCLVCQATARKLTYSENAEEAKKKSRAWYASNKDRARATHAEYEQKHKKDLFEYRARYREENRDKLRTQKAAYYQENSERLKKKSLSWYYANHAPARKCRGAWRAKNLHHARLMGRIYSATPKGKETARRSAAKYRARKAFQLGVVSLEYKEAMLEALGGCCPRCGVTMGTFPRLAPSSLTWDHVIPISKGGVDDDRNLLPLCHSCNTSKGDKSMEEWVGHAVGSVSELRRKDSVHA